MILTGARISEEVKSGAITISPFDAKLVNPNSYDFRLGDSLLVYEDTVLDAKRKNTTKTIRLTNEGYTLQPNRLYLGHTQEIIGSDLFVPIIRGKSSTGRVGLFVHITADLIDIGSIGQITLMLHAVQPIKIYPGMRVGQVTFWRTTGKIDLYNGKYQASSGPVASQSYKDFESA